MKFQKISKECPLCSSKNIFFLFKIIKFTDLFDIYKCSDCNFQFMNPIFKKDFLKSLYSEKYYKGSSDYSYVDERKYFKYNSYVWDARLKNIRKYVNDGNFLDVGCSFGGLLIRAQKYFNIYGIEISKYSYDHAKEFLGKNIHKGSLDNHHFKNDFFNVITMVEVIEHLQNPVKYLKESFDLLKYGGMLLIQTADMEAKQSIDMGCDYHYYLPGHVSYFSEQNLTSTLEKIGFSKTIVFRPVDFGLIPKLLKSRSSFKSILDYKKWISISMYHLKGYFKKNGKPRTSSMVIYAFK